MLFAKILYPRDPGMSNDKSLNIFFCEDSKKKRLYRADGIQKVSVRHWSNMPEELSLPV